MSGAGHTVSADGISTDAAQWAFDIALNPGARALRELVGRALFLAAGQDDPHSTTITELAAALRGAVAQSSELLKALENLTYHCEAVVSGEAREMQRDLTRMSIDRARAAIAKATGGAA